MTEKQRLEACVEPLISWFEKNQRQMPWRSNPKPYDVWVSEIMLQQTRVEAVRPYFKRFLEVLPDMEALAACSEEQLLKLWEGLGYYSRVKNMKKAAMICVEQHGGTLPSEFDALLALPGIGRYTAGAISSIAYLKPVPVVDGNVLRVISRLLADESDISQEGTKKRMEKALLMLLQNTNPNPSKFNQGLMELGAMVCVPNGEPKCDLCPWKEICLAKKHGLTEIIPVKTSKKPRLIQEKTVLVLLSGNRIGIVKRPDFGLLAGLFQLPNVEGYLTQEEVIALLEKMGTKVKKIENLPFAKHVFSHIEWEMRAYQVEVDAFEWFQEEKILWVTAEELEEHYALPGAFKKWKMI